MDGACGKKFAKNISHNVPAVCDVFAARIRALRSKGQGCKNVGGVSRGRRSRPRRMEPWRAVGPERIQTCYAKYKLSFVIVSLIAFPSASKSLPHKELQVFGVVSFEI
jgi:hypothetical protein